MKKPTASIGVPVFNGENYLARALDSILAQTYTDYEIILCDNASTDRTQEICEQYAAQDNRIRYFRHEVNRGATWNFNFAFTMSSGIYFNWLAHDDEFAPTYLEKCVSLLDSHPDAALCFTKVMFIDEHSKPLGEFDVELRTHSGRASQRFYDLLMVWHDCLPIFGLIRSSALSKTPLMGGYSLGDAVLLAKLGLLGRFEKVSETLFLSRRHALQSNKQFNIWVDHHAYSRWFVPANAGRLYLPQWKMMFELFFMVFQAEISLREKLLSHGAVFRWAVRYRTLLLKDWIFSIRSMTSAQKQATGEPVNNPTQGHSQA